MDKYVLGISAYYHDSSVCLFKNDELIFACEEEKFTGKKHDSSFPHSAIRYIFQKYNLNRRNIERVCYYEDPRIRLTRKKSFFLSLINNIKVLTNLLKISHKIHYTKHHLSHMTYSYLSSNFKNSAIISIDGVGETETLSIGVGNDNSIKVLKTVKYPHSMGLFYSAMTAFLGFKPNEGEYKVMGLASYGDPNVYIDKVSKLIWYQDTGEIKCNMNYFDWDKSSTLMFNHKLEELLGMETRLKDTSIEQKHKDLAASVQKVYENVFFKILEYTKKITDSENLCLGGGCAYNGTANGKVVESGLFKHLWIPPAPSDAGSSIGSCLNYKPIRIHTTPFLGPSYSMEYIKYVLNQYDNITYMCYTNKTIVKKTAQYLNDGLVVGWFKGNIEFGARALGNRSILANPTVSDMKDKINKVIKKRENFRPFAPMVCYDKQTKYFESKEFIPYMNQVVKVKNEYKDKLIAITHVDGTARVQSVIPQNPIYELLNEFEKLSGYPILLNTSFNIKDKTMVLTPEDAIETFLNTEMDLLILENYLIFKK